MCSHLVSDPVTRWSALLSELALSPVLFCDTRPRAQIERSLVHSTPRGPQAAGSGALAEGGSPLPPPAVCPSPLAPICPRGQHESPTLLPLHTELSLSLLASETPFSPKCFSAWDTRMCFRCHYLNNLTSMLRQRGPALEGHRPDLL